VLVNTTGITPVFVTATIIFYCVFEYFLSSSSIFHIRNFDTMNYKTYQYLNWKTLVKSVIIMCSVFYSVQNRKHAISLSKNFVPEIYIMHLF